MCARNARQRWALVVALLVSLVAAASAHASGPRAARRALRADVPTSVTGDSLVVTDADPDASSSSIDAALVRRVAGDAGCVIVTWGVEPSQRDVKPLRAHGRGRRDDVLRVQAP